MDAVTQWPPQQFQLPANDGPGSSQPEAGKPIDEPLSRCLSQSPMQQHRPYARKPIELVEAVEDERAPTASSSFFDPHTLNDWRSRQPTGPAKRNPSSISPLNSVQPVEDGSEDGKCHKRSEVHEICSQQLGEHLRISRLTLSRPPLIDFYER